MGWSAAIRWTFGFGCGEGAHGLISTPGATRFYASDDQPATQRVTFALEPGARLEWLPLEAIAYPGCRARNHGSATLAEGAELMAWDVTALGLPNASQPFFTGHFEQRLSIPGLWLEQAQTGRRRSSIAEFAIGSGRLALHGHPGVGLRQRHRARAARVLLAAVRDARWRAC